MIMTETLSSAFSEVSRQNGSPAILTRIYEPDCQLAVWRRLLPAAVLDYITGLERQDYPLNLREVLPTEAVTATLSARLPDFPGRDDFVADVQQLAEMFACLFDLKRVGIRLAGLQTAMCPRFHVDRVPCRLVTTYTGPGTHWLNPAQRHQLLDEGGREPEQWQQLVAGEVALLKGDGWQDNEGRGLWHRSPPVPTGYRRLFLSLDVAE
ncbi:DUF1826 domain-containing protein [Oceanisphaera sp. KMM 10153]|uniref:DUF1826 domain-containing protein n=1 Tax=Oceanisphaera submarina TaxID=3390193 RepID=UPI0039766652